jgi:hypothetical protein
MVFHPGVVKKVLKSGKDVVRAATGVEAIVEMWDENVFTVPVEAKISTAVKEGDVVLVDYAPVSQSNPAPRQVVTAVLRGKAAEACLSEYKEFFARQKRGSAPQTTPAGFR